MGASLLALAKSIYYRTWSYKYDQSNKLEGSCWLDQGRVKHENWCLNEWIIYRALPPEAKVDRVNQPISSCFDYFFLRNKKTRRLVTVRRQAFVIFLI